jgi:cytoskeletal protein CcmA (bactofilin family)
MFTRTQETPKMERKDGVDAANMMTLLTVRGEGARIEGKFEIADSLEVQCEIGGELDVGGSLVIGERGAVTANVRTVDAIIMGTYEGDMIASGNVEITATGRVTGNLKTDSLVIAKGGFFNGNVSKIDEDDARRMPKRENVRAIKEEVARAAKDDAPRGGRDEAAPSRPPLSEPESASKPEAPTPPLKPHGLGS